jgi:type IV secretory pathway ATPase VirB11/archaellum biosynthesis ATPase
VCTFVVEKEETHLEEERHELDVALATAALRIDPERLLLGESQQKELQIVYDQSPPRHIDLHTHTHTHTHRL